ncbi:hypothetical protein MPTK1_6g07450 [Marchantia polymorpha subsp. ruderalis]|uniref:F-box domain-containing protein n=2 Tax=Marchantia polymorpha TaxID=3197 RepID=A0AAF6BPI8_MARPO|nr:hypothetical protein MARPO_0053s0059 [Marchantia polymorpha]PTQ38124.1 hypothetical protein MARPO_0053s0059 [Marchantia polymorpha]BBN13921.1 hypothetical protein Mp_6g07450 [Marchantia polymorpha subsp. ruderalis]BBN13922.1 hypothetical protein Mp_6g07450 [Marchantia polymorpha subsp. ruderalis]|eukprot:PTQ38123.1 hypothetical protein MARPO_0053s0059 [Marchantia polymorpha]
MEVTEGGTSRFTFDFPQFIVEKILARLPFPQILEVRRLSKQWCSMFADRRQVVHVSRKLKVDPQVLRDSSFFQSEIASVSSTWPTYFPCEATTFGFIGFELSSNRWKEFALHPWLPSDRDATGVLRLRVLEGPLLCRVWTCGSSERISASDFTLKVQIANVVTGSWLDVTSPEQIPFDHGRLPCAVHLIRGGCPNYKILLLYNCCKMGVRLVCTIQLYASELRSWQLFRQETNMPQKYSESSSPSTFSLEHSAIHNKCLYGLFSENHTGKFTLVRFCIGTQSWTLRHFSFGNIERNGNALLHFSPSSLGLMVPGFSCYPLGYDIRSIDINIDTLEGNSGNTDVSEVHSCRNPVSVEVLQGFVHQNFAYHYGYDVTLEQYTFWVYDIQENTWNILPCATTSRHGTWDWISSAFAPGLDPFAAV